MRESVCVNGVAVVAGLLESSWLENERKNNKMVKRLKITTNRTARLPDSDFRPNNRKN